MRDVGVVQCEGEEMMYMYGIALLAFLFGQCDVNML